MTGITETWDAGAARCVARRERASDRAGSVLDDLLIRRGSALDYAAMSHWHYRPHDPATTSAVLVAVACGPSCRPPVRLGVLVVSMPVLNGRWRAHVWRGRYGTGDKRADARRLNREVRMISRVVVDPRARGLGVARRLVRAYLDDPLTPATEAVAAMGTFSSFFVAAGMRAYPLTPTPAQARFVDCLESLGTTPEAVLACARTRRALAKRPDVVAELDWFHGNAARRWFDRTLSTEARLADVCARVIAPITAFAHAAWIPAAR